ncbi:NADH-ubiquinone oxidoreductase chain [Trichinella spiralis]|uniref:NADH-ubiquinone oxidoreductase chain 4 n=1 Tax=Trichinella spiralis TaxID=6334 RepID=A0ABR3K6K1_TRISP
MVSLRVVMVIILLPFVVKLPVYLFHLWLPKAHVEAPVLGRMILASILLKTGGYGLVKNDLKKFVAYSSVTHMTMVLGLVVMGFEVLDSAVTRLLFKQQGLLRLSPVVWFFLVFLLFIGSRVPPSVGIVGEVSLVVLLLASWVLYYASSYMGSSIELVRFNVLMVVFVLRMLVVVVGKSFWVL